MNSDQSHTKRLQRLGVRYDPRLLFPVLFLVGIGVVMVYSASSQIAIRKYGSDYHYLARQSVFALAGLAVLIGCRHIPYHYYRRLVYPMLAAAFILLALVHVPGIGYTAGGATRWLHIGGISFQPVEYVRLAMVIYLAYSLARKGKLIQNFSVGFVPHVVVLGFLSLMILSQPDFGSTVILIAIGWVMMFVAGVRMRYLLLPAILLIPLAAYLVYTSEYRWLRWMSFWNPWEYADGAGYQIIHSLMAFGTGGIWGVGIGQGYQKLFYLPEPHTDFIFSVIGEELGLLGVFVITGLYAMIVWRGFTIALRLKDPFGALMAAGLTTALAFQAGINMAVTLSLLPTKGLTLPFLSYGGSSLLLSMASIGILMNLAVNESKPRGRS